MNILAAYHFFNKGSEIKNYKIRISNMFHIGLTNSVRFNIWLYLTLIVTK